MGAKTAKQAVAEIESNVDRFYADAIDFAEFNRLQRAAWDAAAERGPAFKNAMTRLICSADDVAARAAKAAGI